MSSRITRRALKAGLAMSLILALAPISAHATTGSEAIALLNAQRAANGIPPVTLDQSLLHSECFWEDHEIEIPGEDDWTAETSPWEQAPRHKALLNSPLATSAAYAVYPYFGKNGEREGSPFPAQCMWFSWNQQAENTISTPRFYSFVGAEGPSAVPLAERPQELPFSAQQAAGLEAEETGPSLIVYALGLGESTHITSASLTTAAGQAVPVRFVDGSTRYEGQEVMSPWEGDVIPVSPLAGGTSYTARIVWEGEGEQATQTFKITSQARCVFYECPKTSARKPTRHRRKRAQGHARHPRRHAQLAPLRRPQRQR
jgi:hypothetical protein